MTVRRFVVLAAALTLATAMAIPAGAAKPGPLLQGTTSHTPGSDFNYPYLEAWEGPITIGDFNGWIEWWINVETWTAWPYVTAEPPLPPPNASHYEMMVLIFAEEGDGDPILVTMEHGTTTLANTTWRANGWVETASGYFSGWEGRRVHESGEFVMGPTAPVSGTSIFRIN